MTEFNHVTVLLNEAVAGLNIKPTGIYVDATLGGGGHSEAILKQLTTGHLYSFDQDQTAIDYNQEHLKSYIKDGRENFIKDNFRHLKPALNAQGVTRIDGIVYDLGVSSPQFDDAKRGFSYQHDALLDMRMDQSQSLSAMEVVNEWHMNVWSRFCIAMAKKSLPSRSRGQLKDSASRLQSRPRLNWLKSLKLQFQRQLGGTADIRLKRAFRQFALRSMMSWAPWRTHWSRRLRCLTLVAASV